MARKAEKREHRVEIFDGRATATVYEVDGYGRPVTETFFDHGPVHERAEAIAEFERAKAAGRVKPVTA